MTMELHEVISEVKQYFKIQELVSRDVYNKYGEEKCWSLFRKETLECLLIIRRDILKVGLVCNDWVYGGKNHARGWRENTCQRCRAKTASNVIYASAHVLGCGFDLVSAKMSAAEMRRKIVENAYLLPCQIRMELNVSWLHFDTCVGPSEKRKVTTFTA